MPTEFAQLFDILRQATQEALCISARAYPIPNVHGREEAPATLLLIPNNGTWGLAPIWEPVGG